MHAIPTLLGKALVTHELLEMNKCVLSTADEKYWQKHFLDWKYCILTEISQKFDRHISINNKPALFQIRSWCRTGSKMIWTNDGLVYWCIYTSLGLDGFTKWAVRPGWWCLLVILNTLRVKQDSQQHFKYIIILQIISFQSNFITSYSYKSNEH